jgi:hypothetical protein
MSDTNQKLPLLALPKTDYVGEKAFHNDQLNREKLATHLTSFLNRLKEGAVLAIDAPWGEGKTWFGRNWAKKLESSGHEVIFIDAFEQDYLEDPFMLLSAEILEVMGENDLVPNLTETATNIAKALVPMGTKMIVNTIGQWALGTSNLSDKAKEFLEGAVDDGAEVSSGWIKDRLTKHAGDKALMQQFKEQLSEFANTDPDRPIVIFIDELDRCKPTFAVELIERIKHFFDVPNIVFVLLLNRNQLEKAVKGVYGAETDAALYLSKFVNFFFKLPKEEIGETLRYDRTKRFVLSVAKMYKFGNGQQTEHFFNGIALLTLVLNLSLRDIERCIALYAFAYPHQLSNPLLAYVTALKVSKHALFKRILVNDIRAHELAKEQIDVMNARLVHSPNGDRYLNALSQWHQYHIEKTDEVPEAFRGYAQHLGNYYIGTDQIFQALNAEIDLPMEFR